MTSFKPLPKKSSTDEIFVSLTSTKPNLESVTEVLAEFASLERLKEENAEERFEENPPPWVHEDDREELWMDNIDFPRRIW